MTEQMTMVFRSRFSSKRPINSRKHIVDKQGGIIGGAANTIDDIADAIDSPTLAQTTSVQTGCTVSSIFLNIQVATAGTAALANIYFALIKNPGNNITFPAINTLGSADSKKHVLHQEMIMGEKNTTAIPRTMFRGVLMIPRGKRRFGADDKLAVYLFSPGVDFDYCFQCIYKEYR